jgi:hypothetical protein
MNKSSFRGHLQLKQKISYSTHPLFYDAVCTDVRKHEYGMAG